MAYRLGAEYPPRRIVGVTRQIHQQPLGQRIDELISNSPRLRADIRKR